MKKNKVLSLVVVMMSVLMLGMTTATYATDQFFSATLPGNKGDAEVGPVRKVSEDKYFSINITRMSGGNTDMVCAWTKDYVSYQNYSSPYNQVAMELTDVSYYWYSYPVPKIVVLLYMDNPVNTDLEVSLGGVWTPR